MQVESAGHGKKSSEDIGMAQRNIDCVKSAKAAAERGKMGVAVFAADERNNFVNEVAVVLNVPRDAPARRDLLVVPALHVDRVDAKDLALACVDFAGERGDHAAIFNIK